MKYVDICTSFSRRLWTTNVSPGQIALFYALVNLKNMDNYNKIQAGQKFSWTEKFPVTRQNLATLSGLSVSGVLKARNKLKQLHLIDFQPVKRTSCTQYWFTINTSTQDRVQGSTQDRVQVGVQDSTPNKNIDIDINTNQSKLNAPAREKNLIPIFKLNGEVK